MRRSSVQIRPVALAKLGEAGLGGLRHETGGAGLDGLRRETGELDLAGSSMKLAALDLADSGMKLAALDLAGSGMNTGGSETLACNWQGASAQTGKRTGSIRIPAGVAQLVERNLAKVEVAGSNPVTRFFAATLGFGGSRRRFVAPNGSDADNFRLRGVAQSGRALRSGRRGPRFKSGRPDFRVTPTVASPCRATAAGPAMSLRTALSSGTTDRLRTCKRLASTHRISSGRPAPA